MTTSHFWLGVNQLSTFVTHTFFPQKVLAYEFFRDKVLLYNFLSLFGATKNKIPGEKRRGKREYSQ